MKKLFAFAVMAAMVVLSLGADAATPKKKKAAVKKGASKTAGRAPAKKGPTTASSKRKAPAKKGSATTWRNRQLAPSTERYHEIQNALVAKGYLNGEDANGSWNQNSIDALKKFQAEQNLDASGKINSLSLIALGLGPKRETTASAPPPPKVPQ